MLRVMMDDVKDKLLVVTDTVQIHQLQGQAQALKAIVNVLEQPTLEELKSRGAIS